MIPYKPWPLLLVHFGYFFRDARQNIKVETELVFICATASTFAFLYLLEFV
jgi:hypothetical protein